MKVPELVAQTIHMLIFLWVE